MATFGNTNQSTSSYQASAANRFYGSVFTSPADMGVGEIVFVWIKRVIGAGASAASAVNFTIRIEGDTAA